MAGNGSNEANWEGRRIVIKCAGVGTSSVGVTHRMLERLDAVVAAFQLADGRFDLIEMTPEIFKAHMRETQSTGASAGKVGLVSRQSFREIGKMLKTITLG